MIASEKKSLKSFLENLKNYLNPRIQLIFQRVENEDEAMVFFKKVFEDKNDVLFDGTSYVFKSPIYNTKLISSIHESSKYFEFEYTNKKFYNIKRCEYLNYINDKSFLGINDKFKLIGASNHEYEFPEIGDRINDLWQIYTNNKKQKTYEYHLAIGNWYKIIKSFQANIKNMKKKTPILIEEFVKIHNKKHHKNIHRILRKLDAIKIISLDFIERNEIASISVLNDRFIRVLTDSGHILEAYIYFKCLESNLFDDIATNYRFFHDEFDSISNEIDIILTKGFNTLIVECKSVHSLNSDYYNKLNSVGGFIGSSSKKVMLFNDYNVYLIGENEKVMQRGNLMDIETINVVDENIAKTLNDLF
jgi:hypothetical protein